MLACFRYTCGYQYHTRASFIIIFIILEIDFIFELLTYNRENDRTFKQGFTVKHSHSQNPESTCSNQMVYNLIRSNTRAPEKGEGGGVNRVNAYSISLLHDKLYLHVFYIRFDSLGPLENKEKRAHYHE